MWSSALPWEKFNLVTSTPAAIIADSDSGESVAGPRVATILVRLNMVPVSFCFSVKLSGCAGRNGR
jgi:hypothetical protein